MDEAGFLVRDMERKLLFGQPQSPPKSEGTEVKQAVSRIDEIAKNEFEPRIGIDIVGRGVTSAPTAILQMLDGHGKSPAQLDRDAAMRGPLYSMFLREHPEHLEKIAKGEVTRSAWRWNETDRRMLAEDLNSVKIKYDNWRKRKTGQELTTQERITEGFIDVRNPNSWF
jgi:hypothetical protein